MALSQQLNILIEDHAAFEYAEKLALERVLIFLLRDPDCVRLAVEIIDHDGQVFAFNGNQIGVILVDYVLTLKEKIVYLKMALL